MPLQQCGCDTFNEHSIAYPQSYQRPQTAAERTAAQATKKLFVSYNEGDPNTIYAFQRKKKFGVKNGSSAVAHCLEWAEEGLEASPGRPRTAKKPTPKVGSDDDEDGPCEGRVRTARRPEKEPTPKIGHELYGRTCAQAADDYEVEQLKLALQRNEISSQKLLASLKQKGHTCGGQQLSGGGGGARPAWQQMPLSQVLDGETGFARDLRSASPAPQPGYQNESVQTNSARFSPETFEPSTRSPTGFALPLAQIAAREQQQQQQQQTKPGIKPVVLSARLSARVSARKDRSTQEKHDVARKTYSVQSESMKQLGGEGATHPPTSGKKKGLGNTVLGSPHDPRELHDPESIDPVWRRREEAKERARRLNSLLGNSAADNAAVDEKQYAASILKQHARRLKIKNFETRHTEKRLRASAAEATTREFSETWMSVLSGKPPFCGYGNGNTAPTSGGVVYGNYMLSHSCSPERRPNRPSQKQTTNEARRTKETKQRENAKTLRRLLAAGEVVPEPENAHGPRSNTAQKLRGEYDERGRAQVDVGDVERHPAGIAVQPLGTSDAVPQPLHAADRNVSSHFGPSTGEMRLPLDRALAWQTTNHTQEARRSGRRQGFEQQGANSLAETSARTMSVLPQPEAHPGQQAWYM